MCNLKNTFTYTLLSFLTNKHKIIVKSYSPRYMIKPLEYNCYINQHENY